MNLKTREKYIAQSRMLQHLREGHRGRLPQNKSIIDVILEGWAAALKIDMDLATRELQCENTRLLHRLEDATAAFAKEREALNADLSAAKAQLEQAKAEKAKLAASAILLHSCPRMNVRAVSLPCGDRPECWAGSPCDRIPEGKEPKARPTGMGIDALFHGPQAEPWGLGRSLPTGDA